MGLANWLRGKLTAESRTGAIPDTTPTAQRPLWMRDGMRATEIVGEDDLRVIGEPGHQEVLRTIVGPHSTAPVHALLVAEHGHPEDRNAVAVWVGGHRVGRLDDADAGRLRPGLIRLQRRHRRAVALPGHVGGDHDGLGLFLSYDADAFGVRSRT